MKGNMAKQITLAQLLEAAKAQGFEIAEAPTPTRKGTGKAVTGQVRASVTTKAIDNASPATQEAIASVQARGYTDTPSSVALAIEAAHKQGLASFELPKQAKVKLINRCAAHSVDALRTYMSLGGRAARAFMGGEAIPEDCQDGQFGLVEAGATMRYAKHILAALTGVASVGTPAPAGKRVARSRKGTAQGSPSRSPKQLANDKRLGEAAKARHAANRAS